MASSTSSSLTLRANSSEARTSTTTSLPSISLLALTTPFVAPAPSCASIFTTTSKLTSYFWNNYTISTLAVIYSDPGDSRFAACQPSGWDEVVSSSRFHFSPAVCPDKWTAYNLVGSYVDHTNWSRRVTTAYCCASGYTLGNAYEKLASLDTRACISNIGVPATTTISTTSQLGQPGSLSGMQIHNAYQISWEQSDRATLSPTPPATVGDDCDQTLSVWVPGESVSMRPCNGGTSGDNTLLTTVLCAIIIPTVIVASCCTCICRHYRREKRGLWRSREKPGAASGPTVNEGIQLENTKS